MGPLIWTEDVTNLIHAFDAFYKPVTEAMASQNGEEILVRDPVIGLLKV